MSRVAVVTGGSKGIGAAIVRRLAKNNMNIVINYLNSKDAAEKLKSEIISKGCFTGEIELYKADVSIEEEASGLLNFAGTKFGTIDVLINNAGVSNGGPLFMKDLTDWWKTIQVNLGSTVNCTRASIPYFLKNGSGNIINIGSVAGLTGVLGNSDYASSKAALVGFTKSMARELVNHKITINTVAPGFIATDMVERMNPKRKKDLLAKIPAGRIGSASEVAELVSLLASGSVNYILGQTIVIDGGVSM